MIVLKGIIVLLAAAILGACAWGMTKIDPKIVSGALGVVTELKVPFDHGNTTYEWNRSESSCRARSASSPRAKCPPDHIIFSQFKTLSDHGTISQVKVSSDHVIGSKFKVSSNHVIGSRLKVASDHVIAHVCVPLFIGFFFFDGRSACLVAQFRQPRASSSLQVFRCHDTAHKVCMKIGCVYAFQSAVYMPFKVPNSIQNPILRSRPVFICKSGQAAERGATGRVSCMAD